MAHMTGANTTPLGRLHPVLAGKQNVELEKPGYKRPSVDTKTGDRKKKKRSRWGTEDKKMVIPGMPTTLPPNLNPEQQKAYIYQLRIEEISRMLRTGELGIPENPEDRSPSPEPIYNTEGKRLNTRDFRVRKRLEEERHVKIQEALKLNPDFKPPADYKPPIIKIQDKVMIPQDENPEVNFIGLLIGPRGNTLKNMEKESNAKIMIRGKGSIKDGKVWQKGGNINQQNSGEDEELHALVTGPTHESVAKAVAMIQDILKQGIEAPEGQNDLKRMQLRELAALNGTLREDELLSRCRNCGAANHRHWECPEQRNVTNSVICTKCGGAGHLANDCVQKEGIAPIPNIQVDKAKMDSEYLSLMAELGEGPPPPPVVAAPPPPPPPIEVAPLPVPAKPPLANPAPAAPWNAPKPLMSTPVPRPNIRPPANGSGGPPQPPWSKQQGLLPPPGHPHGINTPRVPFQSPVSSVQAPPPPPATGTQAPPWQTSGNVPPWQVGRPQGFAPPPPPPPTFTQFQPPPPPPPTDSPWGSQSIMAAPPPPPPPPPSS
ncbi:splicing factor 1 [Exaiptasia diaphana]|uniref:Branchpoint-bridging protein n=1 Tax=Exaiptasia diaphana TaxID=2652724 RepID=A0A913WWZ7_EXADI|nr:splicing factor 1 [Exaiptasia diaphana]KXJ27733.1 Splicing factor 1 [Exaiptasia diaphana]